MAEFLNRRYEVLETLGRGGEGRVVKALDHQHGRLVALKIRTVRGDEDRDELLAEARVLLDLPPHPGLPIVRDDFFEDDSYVIAMDFVDGIDLARLLSSRGDPGLAPSSVLSYLAEVAEALTHLHVQHPCVIHGDVKPGNLILTRGGHVKLVDFGMSSTLGPYRRRIGTPGFRAPELASGMSPSRPTDIYALAATAFTLLTGSPPVGELPSWGGVSAAEATQLEAALRRGLATDPERRPATPGEFVESLLSGWSSSLPTGTMTFCLSDIEGSTALWDERPESMALALVRHDELISEAVEARRGRLLKSMGEGDSTVSVFTSAFDAMSAAIAASEAFAAEAWPDGLVVKVRFGLHTGEAQRRGTDYFGPTVNLAARLRAQADGGQLFCSATTGELVGSHLPNGYQLVDLGEHRLRGIRAPERVFAVSGNSIAAPFPATECPYRGLLAFEAENHDLFFGREHIVDEMVERLEKGRILALVGASGSGKSSVLRAGLMARAVSGEVPVCAGAVLTTPGSAGSFDVEPDTNTLVVVDQFEEVFTLCTDDAQGWAYIDALLRHPGPIAIGVRADFYGQLSAHAELALAVTANQILLGAMNEDELRQAIRKPAELAGLKLEPGLIEVVIRDVRGEPGALPLLSHALRATWDLRDGRTLTVDGYKETGGVRSALARTADRVFEQTPPDTRGLLRGVFLRLTEIGEGVEDTRRRVDARDLVPEGGSANAVDALLERLADERLITLDRGTVEVAHEALIREWPTLRSWLDEDRESLRLHRRLGDAAGSWDAAGREASDLFRGVRLTAALDWSQHHSGEMNTLERDFVAESHKASERETERQRRMNRRLRGLLAGTAVLLVVALVAGVVAAVQRSHARQAQTEAEAQALKSDAERIGTQALAETNLDRSLLLAIIGVRLDNLPQTRSDLLAVLQRTPAAIHLIRSSQNALQALSVSPDGQLMAAGDASGAVYFEDLQTWKPSGPPVQLPAPIPPRAMTFSHDGRSLAVATGQGASPHLYVIDVTSRTVRQLGSWPELAPPSPAASTAVAFSPSGRNIAVALAIASPSAPTPRAERLLLLDTQTGRTIWQRSYPLRPGQWEANVAFSAKGLLVTSAEQGDTDIWNPRTGQIIRRFPTGGRFALSPDGRTAAVGINSPNPANASFSVAVLDLRTGALRKLQAVPAGAWMTSVMFTPDGRDIIGASFDGNVREWDVSTGSILQTFVAQPDGISEVAVDVRGLTVLSAGKDGSVVAWDLTGIQRLGRGFQWNTPQMACPSTPCFVLNPQGTLMATSQADGSVVLIDVRSLRPVATLSARNGPTADALAFSPDGRTLITGGVNGHVTFWDTQSRTVSRTLRLADPVWWVAVSPNGELLAIQTEVNGSPNSEVQTRDIATGRVLQTSIVRDGDGGLTFNPDGRELAALGCCQPASTVAVWDTSIGAEIFSPTMPTHTTATAIAFSADGRLLAAGTADGRVVLWDATNGSELGPPIQVAAGGVDQISFSPDGHLFAVGSSDGTATLWDLQSRQRIGSTFPNPGAGVPALAFGPDNSLMIAYLSDATDWPTDAQNWEQFACQVAGRDLTQAEWQALLPNRPYQSVCPQYVARR